MINTFAAAENKEEKKNSSCKGMKKGHAHSETMLSGEIPATQRRQREKKVKEKKKQQPYWEKI